MLNKQKPLIAHSAEKIINYITICICIDIKTYTSKNADEFSCYIRYRCLCTCEYMRHWKMKNHDTKVRSKFLINQTSKKKVI